MIIAPTDLEAAEAKLAALKRDLEEAQEAIFWARVDERVNKELESARPYADMKPDGTFRLFYGAENVEARSEELFDDLIAGCLSDFNHRSDVLALKATIERALALVEESLPNARG